MSPSGHAPDASRLGAFYDRVYGRICGEPPHVRPCHFQWLAVKDLYADLRRVLPRLEGRVLDVGCGNKPYAPWLRGAEHHVGIDVLPGPAVDLVIEPERRWPLEDASFDAVLCTQVLEHAADLSHLLGEVGRVLRPGGTLVLTVPFAYNEHGAPDDYRRFSVHGVRQLLADGYEILELRPQGAIGSTLGILTLNWIEQQANHHRVTRLAKGALLPAWVLLSSTVNVLGWLLDRGDRTQAFYGNVLVVARRRSRAAGNGQREERPPEGSAE